MTLDEQLKMATSSVSMTPNVAQEVPATASVQTQVAQGVPASEIQAQAAAQVVQPTMTAPVDNPTMQVNQVPVQNTTVTSASMQNVTPIQGIDLNKAAEEAETNYSVQTIEIGQKISTRAIDPVGRIDMGKQVRLAILNTTDWTAVKVHNHADLGKIICWGGECCKDDPNPPRVRYCIPVMVYSTLQNDANVIVPQGKSELKLLILWDTESYDSLCECIINNKNDVSSIDIKGKSIDNYGKLMFSALPTARAQVQAEYNAAVEKWNVVKDKALATVGRQLNDEKYLKLTQKATPPVMQEYDMNAVMNNQ